VAEARNRLAQRHAAKAPHHQAAPSTGPRSSPEFPPGKSRSTARPDQAPHRRPGDLCFGEGPFCRVDRQGTGHTSTPAGPAGASHSAARPAAEDPGPAGHTLKSDEALRAQRSRPARRWETCPPRWWERSPGCWCRGPWWRAEPKQQQDGEKTQAAADAQQARAEPAAAGPSGITGQKAPIANDWA